MSRIDWKRSAGSFSSAFSTTVRNGERHVLRQRPGGAMDDRVQHVGIGRSGKGSLSGQHLVQHHAEGENIASGIERLS